MKLLLLVSLLVYSIQAHQLGVDESIDELHSSKDHWIAENNFLKETKKEVLSSLVVAHSSVKELKLRKFTEKELLLEIPEDYNTIDVYPKCTSIPVVKMQSNCGSCWAVSVAAVFSDRLCIASEGKINIQLSAEEIISCCSKCGSCKGGSTAKAWGFTKQKGLVSGGDYGSNEGCQPYSIKPCGPWSKEKCDKDIADTPKCHKHSCTNKSYKTPFRKDIHKTNKIYRISENITDIQREILINGPVVATFDVYEDFANYSRGIYRWKETSGKKIGEHSVKIVGWGKCKMCGMLYWIGSNTFGSNWGEKGFFKIMQGWNNVGFEKNVSAGLPKVHSKKHKKNNS